MTTLTRRSNRRPTPLADFGTLFNAFDHMLSNPTMTRNLYPPIDVYETEDAVIVEAEVSGLSREDLSISVEDSTLSIEGTKTSVGEASYHLSERHFGKFRRSLSLPRDIDAEAITATCDSGLLKIVVPKAESAKPRKINIS